MSNWVAQTEGRTGSVQAKSLTRSAKAKGRTRPTWVKGQTVLDQVGSKVEAGRRRPKVESGLPKPKVELSWPESGQRNKTNFLICWARQELILTSTYLHSQWRIKGWLCSSLWKTYLRKYLIFTWWTRQGLTSLLCIFIHNGKSGIT